mgnify:CR=1 FL=1
MIAAPILALVMQFLSAKDVPLAVVVRVKGHAQAGPAKALRPLKSGDVVSKDWQIKTESDGQVLLRLLSDRALADIRPSSLVELGARQGKETATIQDITLHGGQIRFQVPGGNSGERANSVTTVATTKAGKYDMSTGVDGNTRVDVISGTVQVCNQFTGESVSVAPGQSQISGYDGFGELVKSTTADNVASSSTDTTSLAVPFTDPVTGNTSILTVSVKRAR